MFYRDLVSDLESDRPVYGLQPQPLDGKHRIPRTTESMAAEYLAEIRKLQPYGPYFLAGHSFGGRLSFEMAQQLVRHGEHVSFLGLIDTIFVETSIEGRPLVSEAVRLTQTRPINGFLDLFARGLRFTKREMVFRRYDRWIRRGRSIPYEHRQAYHDRLCVRASRGYVHKPYPGHITVFSSAGNSEPQRAHWGPLAGGGLTVLEVPAGHVDMLFPPHSKILAGYFDARLAAAVRGE
jgi:thioesterase domain-containing protein